MPPTRPDSSLTTFVLIHEAGDVAQYSRLGEPEPRTRGRSVEVLLERIRVETILGTVD
jgi:hypothetical protein